MNQLLIKDKKRIENMICEIRGKQVMLDSDLAKLYQCKNGTKSINLAVNRNIERFPSNFYFQLTKKEFENLKFQFETSSSNYGGIRKLPFVFTEQRVAMLSSVLRTEIASNVSIEIMRAFVEMRKYISTNLIEQKYINNMVLEHNERISLLEKTFDNFCA
ncbi:MAG: ORF6N domain-containing protein [Bacilli bacterium]|nr:ORF6N domain-containing protein [Bacilli bacterium]